MGFNSQPGSEQALGNATNLQERCHCCDDIIKGEPFHVDDYGEPYCSKDCVESNEDSQNERAYESFLEDFYGGSQPVTIQEQYQAAAEQKRRLS